MDLKKIFADMKDVTEQYEVRRVLHIVIRDESYRLEILYAYSNPDTPWHIDDVYVRSDEGAWSPIDGFPWVQDSEEEGAIRTAIRFLKDRS